MDFGKIENIILVAVAAALGVFFLIAFFAVVSKGKRKCGGADIALRVFASIVMLVCAVLFVGAIFTELTGDTRIDAAVDPAVLYIGGKATELPLSELFVMLTQKTVHEIIIIEFFAAFIALSADCMLANKKAGKKKKVKGKTTAEEDKRAVELEKIRRLGNSAVQKSSVAAADSTAEKTETAAQEQSVEDKNDDFDWRVDTAPDTTEHDKEFVGLSDTQDDGFDSFDDDGSDERSDEDTDESTYTEDTNVVEDNDTVEESSDTVETDSIEDDFSEFEETVETDDEFIEETETRVEREETTDIKDDFEETYAETEDAYASEDTGSFDDKIEDDGETPWYAVGGEDDSNASTDYGYNDADIDTRINSVTGEERPEEYIGASDGFDDVQPDRGIYIPKVRTVERKTKAAKKPATGPTRKRTATAKTESGAPAKKRASSAAKKSTAQKNGGKTAKKPTAAKPSEKRSASTKPDGKKLPVTRRYVILDRTNAVNIFSNYLKDRDGADQDKLKSSINTIIIK